MSSTGNITWLASYPKSGNTWMRAFIINLLQGGEEAADINDLDTGEIACSRSWIEEGLGIEVNELSHDEIERLRPLAYQWFSRHENLSNRFHKVHDSYTYLPNGKPLFPPETINKVVYIVRNPLDLSISFSNYLSHSLDQTIEYMGCNDFSLATGKLRLNYQLPQKLLSWSQHVSSWLNAEDINLLLIRYEDMKFNPLETFSRVAEFLNLPRDIPSIMAALDHCSMEKLQLQETTNGFKENASRTNRFFRKGMVGEWREQLSEKQIAKIISDHSNVMQQLGYLDKDNQLTVNL